MILLENILKSVEGEFGPGKYYQDTKDRDTKRAYGQFYTPDFIIDYILEMTIAKADIVKNPYLKILDPACGAGFFLLKAYDMLKEKFEARLPELRNINGSKIYKIYKDKEYKEISGYDYWQKENLHFHILKHCLYGADVDENALWLCEAALRAKDKEKIIGDLNIIYCDSLIRWEQDYKSKEIIDELSDYRLLYAIKNYGENEITYVSREKAEIILKRVEFWSRRFDYIIGNPPYVGHKELSMDYKRWLAKEYKEVFFDKSDLFYCFYQRSLEVVIERGIIAFISSRYFMESPTGRNLRTYLKNNSKIIQILDFYGEKIFPGAGVATAIFIISAHDNENNQIKVWKHNKGKLKTIDYRNFDIFEINQNDLKDDRWILLSDEKKKILQEIEDKSSVRLGDIVNSFQGIITGCDKAFIMDENTAKALNIEESILKPWIKNSHVERYEIKKSNYKLIYSDLIDEPLKYPNSIMHIYKYKEQLEKRRECKNGIRLWHQLQWGRKVELFLQDKIVYPFKSKNNRFALDTKGNFCSADVYSFILKENTVDYTLPFLLGVLNSHFYDFYFKLFAKKMGSGVYDYYPNTVMDLKLPAYKECREIEDIAVQLIHLYGKGAPTEDIRAAEDRIDSILRQYFMAE